MIAYLINCNPGKLEKSISSGSAIMLYLDYSKATEKMEDVNRELGGNFFQVVEVSVEVI